MTTHPLMRCQYPRWLMIIIFGAMFGWLSYTYISSLATADEALKFKIQLESSERVIQIYRDEIISRLDRLEKKIDRLQDKLEKHVEK